MSHPYRTIEAPKRDPLTLREKAGAVLSGLRDFEPLLELASLRLEPGLPQSERLEAASRLARSTATDRILAHLRVEADPCVQDALACAFADAYARKMREFDMRLCSRTSAMGAFSTVADRDRFSFMARGQAASLVDGGTIVSEIAKKKLESVARGEHQI